MIKDYFIDMETLCNLNYITIDDKKYDFYNALDDNDEIDL